MDRKYNHRSRAKADLAAILPKSWYHLRLSVRHPARVPTWDAIVLTARALNKLSSSEPNSWVGSLIPLLPLLYPIHVGSGATTLHAILELAKLYQQLALDSQVPILMLCLWEMLKFYRKIQDDLKASGIYVFNFFFDFIIFTCIV
ncbi:hypothetical protein K7X08_009597 [Anisodus acutangulus]|uniref:Uncharacterized protein n=1 Tax=Anisodus acutangulus TaxID=402998 RepID=A0A9Q1N173_9SOLA|nr:hypothetical protein K7X08_009597 [Anisodus acutangulus]